MSRNVELHLGVNGAFCTRRWEKPENWMRLTKDLGYPCHEFCADVIDPFFSGDTQFQLAQARETRKAAKEHGIHITDIYTGVATHRFHGLSHSDPIPRQRMIEWIVSCMDIALEMGTDRIGGHWDAIAVEIMEQGEHPYKEAVRRQHEIFRDLSKIGRDKGIAAIYQEQMYIPSEAPWTIKQAEEFLIEVNRKNDGCPVYVTIDVGHMAGNHYGLAGKDLDYTQWLRALAPFAEIIHLQQTTQDASHHWPFTEEYNERGHVRMEPILEAIQYGHEHYEESWVSEHMAPVDKCWLIAEIIPGSTKTEKKLLEELKTSADYLKRWLPEGNLTLTA